MSETQDAKYDPVRSFRMSGSRWEKARRRAKYEGYSMSHIITTLVDGYAAGAISMPKTKVVYREKKEEG